MFIYTKFCMFLARLRLSASSFNRHSIIRWDHISYDFVTPLSTPNPSSPKLLYNVNGNFECTMKDLFILRGRMIIIWGLEI